MEEPPEVFETTDYQFIPPPFIQLKGVLYELGEERGFSLPRGIHTFKCTYVRVRDREVELDARANNLRTTVYGLPLIEVDPEIHFKVIE